MTTQKTARRVLLSVLLGYTGHVSYTEIRPELDNMLFGTPIQTRFDPGSMDDKLSDMLHTGDVILYSRRWYTHHIPMAILIQLYQFSFDCYFDHMGVIVSSPEDGDPYILELNPFGKATLRRYDETILRSQATQINAMRLQPVPQFTAESFAKLEDYMEAVTRKDKYGAEFTGLLSFMWKYYTDKLFGNGTQGVVEDKEKIMCPSSELLVGFYDSLGFHRNLVGDEKFVTVNNFVDNRIRLRCLKGVCEKKNDKSVTYGNLEVVRLKN